MRTWDEHRTHDARVCDCPLIARTEAEAVRHAVDRLPQHPKHRDLAGRYHEWVRWVVGIVESERDRYRVATGVDQVPGFATERPRFTGGVRL